jgi:recombination protein RecT
MADLKNKLANKAQGAVTKQASPSTGMKSMLKKMEQEIAAALPSMVSSERFQRVALTAFSNNPKLQECDSVSFIAAMMESAQLGLEPNTPLGQAYLIPFNSKDGMKVQFQLGYKGLLELAQRSGKVKTLYAHEVRENDKFEVKYGLHQDLIHEPILKGDRGEVIGYYAVYHLDTGGHSFAFMSKDEILEHAKKFSKTFKFGPWQSDFDAMAKKTVIKQLLKYAPLSIEIQRAVSSDESVKSRISKEMDLVENEADSIEVDYKVVDDNTERIVEQTNFDDTSLK